MAHQPRSSPDVGDSPPQPFRNRPWRGAEREAADALWSWHLEVLNAEAESAWDSRDAQRVGSGEPIEWVHQAVADRARRACEAHGLEVAHLAEQVAVAPEFWGAVRFADQPDMDLLITRFAGAHATLLAQLADAAHSWQIPFVQEFARGLFLTGRLIELPVDLKRNRLFIPLADLEQAGVSVAQLRQGEVDEPVRRLLWKQVVRARDALAQSTPLVREVSGRFSRAFRVWWMAAVETLNTIERRKFDVWTRPIRLSPLQRGQVLLQAQFGRTTFRHR